MRGHSEKRKAKIARVNVRMTAFGPEAELPNWRGL
jgi:hypothetical protein